MKIFFVWEQNDKYIYIVEVIYTGKRSIINLPY